MSEISRLTSDKLENSNYFLSDTVWHSIRLLLSHMTNCLFKPDERFLAATSALIAEIEELQSMPYPIAQLTEELQNNLSATKIGRLHQWLSFFNEHFYDFSKFYSEFINVLFDTVKSNELFNSQTQHEFELSCKFFERLFQCKVFQKIKSIESPDYLITVALVYSRCAGMQVRSIIDGISILETDVTNKKLNLFFAHIFIQYENPYILTNSLPFLSLTEIELLMFVLRGKNIRLSENLPVPISKLESFHLVFSLGCDFQLTDDVVKRSIFMAKLVAIKGNTNDIFIFFQSSRTLSFRIDQALKDLDFWKSAYAILGSGKIADQVFIGRYADYLDDIFSNADRKKLTAKTITSMERRIGDWHRNLSKNAFRELIWRTKSTKKIEMSIKENYYVFEELQTGEDLFIESRIMNHCVYSYAQDCARGYIRIWSMAVRQENIVSKILTIEVRQNYICQIRGKYNRDPKQFEMDIIHEWAKSMSLFVKNRYGDY